MELTFSRGGEVAGAYVYFNEPAYPKTEENILVNFANLSV
jgi:hypothetical protein